jgi:hypothetical protein
MSDRRGDGDVEPRNRPSLSSSMVSSMVSMMLAWAR